MSIIMRLLSKLRDRQTRKYETLIFTGKIRLQEVPEWLRMDRLRTSDIHIAAFRTDRGVSSEQYFEDLAFLELEADYAEHYLTNPMLAGVLLSTLEYAEATKPT